MKPSCLDCGEFSGCRAATESWKKAWAMYPGKNDEDAEKRRRAIEQRYQICHEKQTTFQTFKRPERAF